MIKVLVFGTFDGLHEGHKDFFRQAKEYGDFLVVVVGRDSTIMKTKGRPPKFNEQERLKAVQESGLVDEARLGNEGNNPYKVIGEVNPRIICLGYDQTHFTEKLASKIKEMGLHIDIMRLKPFHPEKYKSSILNIPD
jgi:FAD synthetase